MSDYVYNLKTPIEGGRGTIDKLTLKAPTARVFRSAGGWPFRVVNRTYSDGSFTNEIVFEPVIVMKFLSDMSNIDAITLEEISAYDLNRLQFAIFNVLNGSPPEPQS